MAFSIGIWATRHTPQGTVYRWEADPSGQGYVLLDPGAKSVRPSTEDGGPADGPGTALLTQVTVAILRKFEATGTPPETAHRHFG